jgi:hypothetical protein
MYTQGNSNNHRDAKAPAPPKKRYQSKTCEFWIRKGWVLEAVNGKKPILRNDTELLVKDLDEDCGYNREVEF